MTYDTLQQQARARYLTILGGFHPDGDTHLPPECRTVLMLGPDEPAFWPAFENTPEWLGNHPDPMDRWSERVIGDWAGEIGGTALFPFGGPPYLPFFSWAQQTGRIHASPIMLLVHDRAGLFVSFRGALALNDRIDLPPPPPKPCDTCSDRPCQTACPVAAFDGSGYNVAACKTYLSSAAGSDCMQQGCAARRACPVSARYPRVQAQSAYHMTIFRG